jgi:hypothetical protein
LDPKEQQSRPALRAGQFMSAMSIKRMRMGAVHFRRCSYADFVKSQYFATVFVELVASNAEAGDHRHMV